MTSRELTADEKRVLGAMLRSIQNQADDLDGLRAIELDDGGMGSLRFQTENVTEKGRKRLKDLVRAEFHDRDGVLVKLSLSVDHDGRLYELDVWKVDFSRRRVWPKEQDLRILPAKDPMH